MKRLSLALLSLGLTGAAFAALPAATDPTLVSVPQLSGGFVAGLSGYFLQPGDSNGDLDYASGNYTLNTTSSSSELQNVQPGYDYGWGVTLGYIFPNTGNDINLSYLHLDTSDTDAIAGPGPATISPINNEINPLNPVLGFTTASAKANYDLDQVDMTVGQYIDIGCRLTLHEFAGLRWAQFERKLNANYVGAVTTVTQSIINITAQNNASVAEKSDFTGVGPLAGMDISYYLGRGIGIVGHADGALLIGNINSAATLNDAGSQTVFPPVLPVNNYNGSASININTGNTRRIVPVIDGKLGLNYTFLFNNNSNSDLTLEAGYQVSNYFNAIDYLHGSLIGTPLNNGSVSFVSTAQGRTTADMSLNGPYVNLVLHI